MTISVRYGISTSAVAQTSTALNTIVTQHIIYMTTLSQLVDALLYRLPGDQENLF